MRSLFVLGLLYLFATAIFGANGPFTSTSNGLNHWIYWNTSDKSLYHVSEQGGLRDTHLIKHYSAFLYTGTLDSIGLGGPAADTTWIDGYTKISYKRRHDTLWSTNTLEDYNPDIILQDSSTIVNLNKYWVTPGYYLVIAGNPYAIKGVGSTMTVDVRVPTGRSIPYAITSPSKPFLKTLSADRPTNYTMLADPNQKTKLYAFFISDSGLIIGAASWDNGLSWEEMRETMSNAVCTSRTDLSRSGLNAGINASSGQITLTWTGTGTTTTTLSAPVTLDTLVMYVRYGDAARDEQFKTVTGVSAFRSAMTPSTPFNTISRCIDQIVMLENGKTFTEINTRPLTDTAMGPMCAVATRKYCIKMLPGNYDADEGKNGGWTPYNKVLFPSYDQGLTIESYYPNTDSFVVFNAGNYGIIHMDDESSSRNVYPYGMTAITRQHRLGHLTYNRLKITSFRHKAESPTDARIFNLPTSRNAYPMKNFRFMNCLVYSMDSSATDPTGLSVRKFGSLFSWKGYEGTGTGDYMGFDNLIFINNLFHRTGPIAKLGSMEAHMDAWDYSGGLIFLNNTFFETNDYGSSGVYPTKKTYYWSQNGDLYGKTYLVNNLGYNSPGLSWPHNGGLPTGDPGSRIAGNLFIYDTFAVGGTVPTFQFLDTVVASPILHKLKQGSQALSVTAGNPGLDSLLASDFYRIPRNGTKVIGACLPGPNNPLRLHLTADTTTFPERSVRVYIDSVLQLSGGIDTVRIFRDTTGFREKGQQLERKADTAFRVSSMPSYYVSRNTPSSKYWFSVFVGQTHTVNGEKIINWSRMDTLINGASIILKSLIPPKNPYIIDSSSAASHAGADSLRFSIVSSYLIDSTIFPREKFVEKIYVYFGTDSADFINNYTNTIKYDTSYSLIHHVNQIVMDTVYNDSLTFLYTNLVPGTKYFVAAVPMDSSTNFCVRDTVVKYMRSFTMKTAPLNVLHVTADTVRGDISKLVVTISGLTSIPALPAVDSTRIKLFVRYGNYIINPWTSLNSTSFRDRYVDIRGRTGDTWSDTISGLGADTLVYISVALPSLEGYYSRIAIDTNTCVRRTSRVYDITAPDIDSCTITASLETSAGFDNGLYFRYRIGGLNTVQPARDRDSLYIKIMWSTRLDSILDVNRNNGSRQEILTPTMLRSTDTLLRSVHNGVYPGRKYYVTAFARDTAYNWRLIDSASVTTQPNFARPTNQAWSVSPSNFTHLNITIPGQFATDISPTTTDSNDIAGVGIWVLDSAKLPAVLNIDSVVDRGNLGMLDPLYNKFIWLDSSRLSTPLDTTILRHNKSFLVLCSPMNVFGNWGKVVAGQSQFGIKTAYDSTKISRPTNTCSLFVSRMRDPDSVRIYWKTQSYRYQYYDSSALDWFYVNYDSVLVYYTTDGSYPQWSPAGIPLPAKRLIAFPVRPGQTDSSVVVSVKGTICGSDSLRFGAFLSNTRPIGAPNRLSAVSSKAQSGPVTPPCAPINLLQITANATSGLSINVHCKWPGVASSLPKHLRFVYHVADSALTPPVSYAVPWTAEEVYNVTWNADQETTIVLTKNIGYSEVYLVGVYNAGSDTVWSKGVMETFPGSQWDTLKTPDPYDRIAPKNELTLTATRVNSRTVNITWQDPNNTLPALKTAEDGKLRLALRYSTDKGDIRNWRTIVDTLDLSRAMADTSVSRRTIRLDTLRSGRTYYFVIAPMDSVNFETAELPGNAIDSHALARDTVELTVPQPSLSGLKLDTLSDTSFAVNFSALLNDSLFIQDTNLSRGLIFVSDSAKVDSNLFLGKSDIEVRNYINGSYNHSSRGLSGRTFLVKQTPVSILSTTQYKEIGTETRDTTINSKPEMILADSINLNKRHFVSFALMTNDGFGVSRMVYIGDIFYKKNAPFFKVLNLTQVDSFAKVEFQASDTSDPLLSLVTRYAINDSTMQTPQTFASTFAQFRPGFYRDLSSDRNVTRDSTYTAYLRVTGNDYYLDKNTAQRRCFQNNDTTLFTLRFALDDLKGSSITTRKTLRVDAKAPSPQNKTLSLSFAELRAPVGLRLTFRSTLSELQSVYYTDSGATNGTILYQSNNRDTTIDFPNVRLLKLSFRDAYGNSYDTLWRYFADGGMQAARPNDKPYQFDNGNLNLTITNLSLSSAVTGTADSTTLFYFVGKFEMTSPVGGFSSVSDNGYYFEFFQPKLTNVWANGATVSIKVDSQVPAADLSSLAIYRYNATTGAVTYVGGTYNNGYVTASGLQFPVTKDTITDVSSDSVFLFLACDTQKVTVHSLSLAASQTLDSLSVQIHASDNTQSLKGTLLIYTFDSLQSPHVLYEANLSDDTISSSLKIGLTSGREALIRGLFAAAWITDQDGGLESHRVFAYSRCPFTLDTVSVTFKNTNAYQLISLPYTLPDDESDVLYAMKPFTGGLYDRERFRLFRVVTDQNNVEEFTDTEVGKEGVAANPNFKFKPGKPFFFITRYGSDNDITLRLKNVGVTAVDNLSRGYLIKKAERDGWYEAAVSYSGKVSLESMRNISILKNPNATRPGSTETYPTLSQRVFFLNPPFSWVKPTNDTLYGKGFLVYLFAGEELYIPPACSSRFLPNNGTLLSKPLSNEKDWVVNMTLKDKQGTLVSGYGELGLTSEYSTSLNAAPSLSGVTLAIKRGKELLWNETRKTSGKGQIWPLVIRNDRDSAGDFTVNFEGLSQNLPEGWQAWLDDGDRKYAIDLIKANGAYPVYAGKHSTLNLKLVIGDASFVKRNVSEEAPSTFALKQNYPNPFNPTTTIRYTIPDYAKGKGIAGSRAVVDIYAINGKLIRRLVDDVANPGYRTAVWNGLSDNNTVVASGTYFYRITVSDVSGRELFRKSVKMVLAK